MVAGLLFKWEDSPALSHHCGFCDRPLHHPGARASCFGTHSEPCHRYHQAMFMRLRSHTCHYCRTIDEAHHRRHKKIAEAVRDVYESCGEFDWNIIPSESEELGRARGYDAGPTESGEICHPRPEDTPSSKRQRKDAKCLARAVRRSRVISQDEIVHVHSVIHSSDGVSGGDSEGPSNAEEMEEIDRHLKYNAHVYNGSQPGGRRALKTFSRLLDVDVDFETEMDRILEAFRISELLRRNTRNRGLQGKDLKTFQACTQDLKKMIVEDLVSVKRDTLETRMRRAGYLRYTNKTAHHIVEDRYSDKDWKTGERFLSSTSDSSGFVSPIEEASPICSTSSKDSTPSPLRLTKDGADLRHLQKTHLRVNGDDRLGQEVIEPHHAPILPASPECSTRKHAVQLKVVTNKHTTAASTSNDSIYKTTVPVQDGVWQTVLSKKKSVAPLVKPEWGIIASGRSVAESLPPANPWGPDTCEIPDFRSLRHAEVQPADAVAITATAGPDRFVEGANTTVKYPTSSHPVVNQKKAKKYEREARRKAKKSGSCDEVVTQDEEVTMKPESGMKSEFTATLPGKLKAVPNYNPAELGAALLSLAHTLTETKVEVVLTTIVSAPKPEPVMVLANPVLPIPPPVAQNSKHMNWVKFKRQFIVDQLTSPCLQVWSRCSLGTSCAYEANGVPDCPFHEPHCSCVDPLLDECYLVYPCSDFLSSGPYNRLRGEKLLTMYQKEDLFKGRIMLVDNDLLHYFVSDPSERIANCDPSLVPKRLATEFAEFADGYNPGPLMEQEKQFERLWSKNNITKRKLSSESLTDVHHQKFENKNTAYMCYCHDKIPTKGLPRDVVECVHRTCTIKYFHKSCVKKLGVDKVTRWFCTICEEKMRSASYKILRELGYDNIPDCDEELNAGMENLRERLHATDEQMDKLRLRIRKMGSGGKMAGMMAIAARMVPIES